MLCQDLHMAEQVGKPEVVMRGWAQGSRKALVDSNNKDSRPQRRDGNAQTRNGQLIEFREQVDAEWDWAYPKSGSSSSGKPRRVENFLVLWADVNNIMENLK